MTVGKKISGGFCIILLLTLVLGYLAISAMQDGVKRLKISAKIVFHVLLLRLLWKAIFWNMPDCISCSRHTRVMNISKNLKDKMRLLKMTL